MKMIIKNKFPIDYITHIGYGQSLVSTFRNLLSKSAINTTMVINAHAHARLSPYSTYTK